MKRFGPVWRNDLWFWQFFWPSTNFENDPMFMVWSISCCCSLEGQFVFCLVIGEVCTVVDFFLCKDSTHHHPLKVHHFSFWWERLQSCLPVNPSRNAIYVLWQSAKSLSPVKQLTWLWPSQSQQKTTVKEVNGFFPRALNSFQAKSRKRTFPPLAAILTYFGWFCSVKKRFWGWSNFSAQKPMSSWYLELLRIPPPQKRSKHNYLPKRKNTWGLFCCVHNLLVFEEFTNRSMNDLKTTGLSGMDPTEHCSIGIWRCRTKDLRNFVWTGTPEWLCAQRFFSPNWRWHWISRIDVRFSVSIRAKRKTGRLASGRHARLQQSQHSRQFLSKQSNCIPCRLVTQAFCIMRGKTMNALLCQISCKSISVVLRAELEPTWGRCSNFTRHSNLICCNDKATNCPLETVCKHTRKTHFLLPYVFALYLHKFVETRAFCFLQWNQICHASCALSLQWML